MARSFLEGKPAGQIPADPKRPERKTSLLERPNQDLLSQIPADPKQSERKTSSLEKPSGDLLTKARDEAYAGQWDWQEVVNGPWMGYVPDLNPHGLNFTAMDADLTAHSGIANDGEKLTSQPGSTLLTAVVDATWTGDFDIGDDGAGLASAPSIGFGESVVVAIGYMQNQSPGLLGASVANRAGSNVPNPAAIVPDPVNTHPYFVTFPAIAGASRGHFFTIDSAGHLIDIPLDNGAVVITATADSPVSLVPNDIMDHVVVPWAGSVSGAGAVQSGAVVFTDNKDFVYVWDPGWDVSGGGGNAKWPGAIVPLDVTNADWGGTFKAKTCEVFAGRVVFLNVELAGSRKYNTIVWTKVASDLVSDGPFDRTSSNGPGTGARDLLEFRGVGVKLLAIGDRLVAYGSRDVAIFEDTRIPVGPIRRIFLSPDRGLVGTKAVCQVERDIHFGIFTDGWFMMNSQGQFVEVGLTEQGHPKWKKTFYAQLESSIMDQVEVFLDELRNKILVSFPRAVGHNFDQWEYDIGTDTVWPWNTAMNTYGKIAPDNVVCYGDKEGWISKRDPSVFLRASPVQNSGNYAIYKTPWLGNNTSSAIRHKIHRLSIVLSTNDAAVRVQPEITANFPNPPTLPSSMDGDETVTTFDNIPSLIHIDSTGGIEGTHHQLELLMNSGTSGVFEIYGFILEGTQGGQVKDPE